MTPLQGERAVRFAAMIAPINTALATKGVAPIGASLLTERAQLLGLPAPSAISANGHCRLIAAADGWIALNLARADDIELLPALLGTAIDGDIWNTACPVVAALPTATLVEQAALLGLPLASLGETHRPAAIGRRLSAQQAVPEGPLVIDLSALWAGPLCAHLLNRLGARVIKIEDRSRPDAARIGSPGFFARLNDGKEIRHLDLRSEDGVAALRAVLASADIVIEGSRPRALAQMGIDAETIIGEKPGMIWASITAHGRRPADAMRVGFGDDAAVAGGLVDRDDAGTPLFVGDAIADPLAGIAATRAILGAIGNGGGMLLDISLAGAAAEITGRVPCS